MCVDVYKLSGLRNARGGRKEGRREIGGDVLLRDDYIWHV